MLPSAMTGQPLRTVFLTCRFHLPASYCGRYSVMTYGASLIAVSLMSQHLIDSQTSVFPNCSVREPASFLCFISQSISGGQFVRRMEQPDYWRGLVNRLAKAMHPPFPLEFSITLRACPCWCP